MSGAMNVAVLGTGLMGGPMAINMARAGHRLTVFNRSKEKALAVGHGARVAASAAAAVTGADAVVVMLPDGPSCEVVLFGDGGAAAAMAPGTLLLVMSSIGVAEARDFAARARGMGLRCVDAPVSGGTIAAEAGTLSIMAGGPAEAVEAARPLLDAMGRTVHVGPSGAGALTKLVNQLLVASTIAAVAEALMLAEAGGADLARVREALLGGFASSRILELHGARMIARDFKPGGPAKYQLKDTRAALDIAREFGLDMPVLSLADRLFAGLIDHGGADLDHSALILELKRRNGLPAADLADQT
jgi:3-hydroxyisobutyrate dehydrogenase-like beta-hydroxyacid dehydrogenase